MKVSKSLEAPRYCVLVGTVHSYRYSAHLSVRFTDRYGVLVGTALVGTVYSSVRNTCRHGVVVSTVHFYCRHRVLVSTVHLWTRFTRRHGVFVGTVYPAVLL